PLWAAHAAPRAAPGAELGLRYPPHSIPIPRRSGRLLAALLRGARCAVLGLSGHTTAPGGGQETPAQTSPAHAQRGSYGAIPGVYRSAPLAAALPQGGAFVAPGARRGGSATGHRR